MAMTTKLKGRLVALLLLAVVLALPVLRMVQRQAASEDAVPPPTVTKSPTTPGTKPPKPKPSGKPAPEQLAVPEDPATSEKWLAVQKKSAEERMAEFRNGGTSTERKRELMGELISMPVGLDELWNAIGTLPEGERAEWFAQLADRCAKEAPEKYFEILDDMSPGEKRSSVIQSGVSTLDFPNLQRMMDQVRKQGDEEEIDALAQNFHYVENPALKSADLLGYARNVKAGDDDEEESTPGAPVGLRASLAYGAGMLDANSGEKTDLARLRRDLGDEAADHYAEGLGTALIANTAEPEKFTGFLAGATLGEETRHYLVQSFAASSLQSGTTEAVALGGKLSTADADAYYQEVGRQLAERDSAEAARVLGRMPAGRARQVMAAQLAEHFESQGNSDEAERWRK